MDFKLRLLLRRYMETGDPEDAVAFTQTFLRSASPGDVGIWIVRVWNEDKGQEDISFHTNQEDALNKALNIAYRVMRSVSWFENLVRAGDLEQALDRYNRSGYCDHEIRVYQDQSLFS
jgi:hypothetical protein